MIETKFYSGRLGKHFEGNESEKSVTIIGIHDSILLKSQMSWDSYEFGIARHFWKCVTINLSYH